MLEGGENTQAGRILGLHISSGVEIGRPFGLRAAAPNPKQRGIRNQNAKPSAGAEGEGKGRGKGLTRCAEGGVGRGVSAIPFNSRQQRRIISLPLRRL